MIARDRPALAPVVPALRDGTTQVPSRSAGTTARNIFIWTALGIAFAIAHTQAPLFFSNQHQYFLHGYAQAGVGDLQRDWLAGTLDPTPVFTAFVAYTQRHLHEYVFQAVFFLLIIGYFFCLMGIGALFVPQGPTRQKTLFFLATLLIVIHAGMVRYASVRAFGVDYPWFFQAGIAGQYVLGPGLQPSAFGVLLLGSVVVFANGRPALAIVLLAAACLIHPTYLLTAALLTATYLILLRRTMSDWRALAYGGLALLLVAPIVVYLMISFTPTSAEQFRDAQQIIADFRIPHHAKAARWFDLIAGLQIAWVIVAIVLVRGTKLFWLLFIPAALSLALSLLQLATDNPTLALFFPWRVSVVLVPIATAIMITRLAALIPWTIETRIAGWMLIWAAAIGGIVIMAARLAYLTDERELPMLEFVRDHKQPGDVCLIPVKMPPNTPGPRGVFSASFTPAPTGQQKAFISVDLQRFRLFTGAAIYVDFKSIPYKDVDVIEWRRRLDLCQKWYAAKDWSDPALRKQLYDEGITHIVMPANRPPLGTGYEETYADDYYRVYRIQW